MYRRYGGFTLIELLVVMSIVALLVAIVGPKYFSSIDRAKEAALKADLTLLREAIDKYQGDRAGYPATLSVLVEERYIRSIPIDPLTESNQSWILVRPPNNGGDGVYDVKSGSAAVGLNGTPYADW